MLGLTLFDDSIADTATTLALRVRQNFDSDYPFALDLDLDTWLMTLDDAGRLSGLWASDRSSARQCGEAKRQGRGQPSRGR